jgi:hypothetical protein
MIACIQNTLGKMKITKRQVCGWAVGGAICGAYAIFGYWLYWPEPPGKMLLFLFVGSVINLLTSGIQKVSDAP